MFYSECLNPYKCALLPIDTQLRIKTILWSVCCVPSSLFCFSRKVTSKNLPLVLCFVESDFCWQSAEIWLPHHLGPIYAKWFALIFIYWLMFENNRVLWCLIVIIHTAVPFYWFIVCLVIPNTFYDNIAPFIKKVCLILLAILPNYVNSNLLLLYY